MSRCNKHSNAMMGVSYEEGNCPLCDAEKAREAEDAKKAEARRPIYKAVGFVLLLVLLGLLVWGLA